MNSKQIGSLRRAGIYFVVGYGGLAVINNSGIAADDMWIAYLPLFIGVYFFARWADTLKSPPSTPTSVRINQRIDYSAANTDKDTTTETSC